MTARVETTARMAAPVGRARSAAVPAPRTSRLQRAVAATTPQTRLSLVVSVFIVTLFLPFHLDVGPITMSPNRLLLILALPPCLFMWLNGKAGRMLLSDFAILAYASWCVLSLASVHGVETGIESGGVMFVESVAPYFLARCFIRSAAQMRAVVRLLFFMVVLLLPFALYESITHRTILLDFFSRLLPSHPPTMNEPRWGLRRVQGVFEHPILYGVTCGAMLAFVHLVLGHGEQKAKRFRRSAMLWFTAFLSLSSGPLSALIAQTALIGWDTILKKNERRWQLLWMIIAAMYVFIAMVSNQSVPAFYLTHFSFDQASAYYRLLIWAHGSQSALNHPMFGVGFGRWDRPDWMPSSIDMFWLYPAVIFGIPAAIFMLLSFGGMIYSVTRRKNLPAELLPYRTAFLITMTGYFLVGWTVHFWGSTVILFLFLLGSCSWLLEQGSGRPARPRTPQQPPLDEEPPLKDELVTEERVPGTGPRAGLARKRSYVGRATARRS